mmetsp:Transcript_8830/g.36088  ORF Transcript_8830/g.36088 Transcript_8830/m.36088 type:complete len:231 (+) Transcript_8830:357-1049(+)
MTTRTSTRRKRIRMTMGRRLRNRRCFRPKMPTLPPPNVMHRPDSQHPTRPCPKGPRVTLAVVATVRLCLLVLWEQPATRRSRRGFPPSSPLHSSKPELRRPRPRPVPGPRAPLPTRQPRDSPPSIRRSSSRLPRGTRPYQRALLRLGPMLWTLHRVHPTGHLRPRMRRVPRRVSSRSRSRSRSSKRLLLLLTSVRRRPLRRTLAIRPLSVPLVLPGSLRSSAAPRARVQR